MALDFKSINTGTVVSNDDPTYSGRIKVRIRGLNDNIDVNHLPWCTYGGANMFSGGGGGSISVPKVGARVRVRFNQDDVNAMEWYGTNDIDMSLREELADDYDGSHVLLYDSNSDLSIMYKNNSGLRLYYKGSYIQITPDNTITIQHGSNNSVIQLSDGQVDIQAQNAINITSAKDVKISANNIELAAKSAIHMSGIEAGECPANANALTDCLTLLAAVLDAKLPATPGIAENIVNTSSSLIKNTTIQHITPSA